MNSAEIEDKIIELVNKNANLTDKDNEVNVKTEFNNLENWNSLVQAMFINDVEKAFKIKFGLQELLKIRSVKDIVNIIASK